MNASVAALRRRVAGSEDGFTITELAAALAILLIALVALARTATVAFSDVANARQRQTGNQLANQLLEEVRGLPFDTIKKGLSSSDLGGDPNILSCGSGVYRYRSCTTGEKIVHSPGLPTTSPLVPHRGSVGRPQFPSTYSWSVYVTEAAGAPREGAYRVTAIVDWPSSARPGVRSDVEAQTLVYWPRGCVDTATHPYGGPCAAYHYATGTVGGGSFTVSGLFSSVSVDDAEAPADYESMTGTLISESADAQLEQVALVQGGVNLPSISRIANGVQTTSSLGAVSAADSDPGTPTGTYDRQPVGPQAPASLRVQSGPSKLDLNLAGNAQGTTRSTTAAGGANECNLQNDGRPCGFASGTQDGAMSLVATLKDTDQAALVSVATSGTPVTTYVRRDVPVAGQSGLLREQLTWNLPEIRLGGLPASMGQPNGWAGYWVRLRGFSATANAEAGTNTSAPSVAISGGTIDAWHGNTYRSVAVTTSGGTVPIDGLIYQTGGGDKKMRVEISGTVSVDPSTTTETITTGTTRSKAEATIGSPFVVEMRYVLKVNDQTRWDLTITFTGGEGRATATYASAPTG